MNTEEIKLMADEFLDGELDKNKEPILFTHLSLDEEAREYFKSLNSIKSVMDSTIEEFPESLDSRILYSITTTHKKNIFFTVKNNIPALLSYALTIMLFIISILFYSQTLNYRETIDQKNQQVIQQNKTIELLMNSLPMTEVTATYANPVKVEAKM
jgi:hypothetical protein